MVGTAHKVKVIDREEGRERFFFPCLLHFPLSLAFPFPLLFFFFVIGCGKQGQKYHTDTGKHQVSIRALLRVSDARPRVCQASNHTEEGRLWEKATPLPSGRASAYLASGEFARLHGDNPTLGGVSYGV